MDDQKNYSPMDMLVMRVAKIEDWKRKIENTPKETQDAVTIEDLRVVKEEVRNLKQLLNEAFDNYKVFLVEEFDRHQKDIEELVDKKIKKIQPKKPFWQRVLNK